MITKRQYEAARRQLEKAQNESVKLMRGNNQVALDKASAKADKAFTIIAQYKAEQASK